MDDMRNRYRLPGRDDEPRPAPPVHENLRHAYQPPPSPRPHAPLRPTHIPAPELQAVPATQPAHQPHHAPAAHHYAHHRPKRRLWRKLAVVLVILAVLAGAGIYAYPKYINVNPFPADIQTNSEGLSLLYPAKLPDGYTVDKTSINLANGVLIYAANNGGKRLVFTLQKTPPAFDFTAFYKQQLTDTQRFQTTYGQATIGKNSGRYLGSLAGGDTWLLLSTSSSDVTFNDMSLVLSNLKKY